MYIAEKSSYHLIIENDFRDLLFWQTARLMRARSNNYRYHHSNKYGLITCYYNNFMCPSQKKSRELTDEWIK